MNVLSKYLTEQILLGEEDFQLKPVVVYSGRFQPFHKGHYETYSHLVKKFGKDNVYIGTSNKVDKVKSPFNFAEKQKIMTTMFGIPKTKIVQIKNPYAPKEILEKFDPEKTAYITVVGEKDASRLGGKYFTKYDGSLTQGYKDKGYVYIAPKGSNISGTMVRNNLGNGTPDEKYDFFKNTAYPKFNKKIFDLVTSKLEEGFAFDKEVIEDWVLNEATKTSTGQDDDGPASFHPNYDVYSKISAKRAKKIGYEVANMIMTKELEDYYEHPEYPNGPVKAVSFYPAGVIGAMTPNNQIDIYSNGAYTQWYKHSTRKATLSGYELVQTQIERDAARRLKNLSSLDAINDKNIEDEFERLLDESITIPVDIGDTILTGKFKNKKTVVKSIGKDDHGMPTINGKKVVTFRLHKKGPNIFDNIVELEDVNEMSVDVKMQNLGILRQDMPQIKSTHVRDFLGYLNDKGVKHNVRKIPVKHLKLTQKDINPDKVKQMMSAPDKVLKKPVLTSIDNYVLDGHHRLLALYNKDKNSKLPSVKIGAPITDLLKYAKAYPKVSYKGINEMLKEGNDKLKLSIPSNIKKLHKAFKKHGKKLYVVGGAVRDAILGKTPKDYDLATDAKPDEVVEIAKKEGLSVAEVGKKFGVVIVNGDEIATFRKDIGKGRRPTSVDYTDIEGDVRRRDLTINALFYDIDRGEIVDLVGGIKDLQDKKIRTVGKAEERFEEDPLRKLRALRFQARVGGKMDKDIMNSLKKDPSLKGVSTERIRDEFVKGIKSAKSTKSYLELAEKLDMLKLILPNLKVSKPYIDENDPIVLLSYILRDNNVDTLRKQLNKLKYTNDEVRGISFLVSLNDFTDEKVNKFKKAQSASKLTDEQIIKYGKLINKDLKKFVNFETSVKGGDAPKDLKGKEIQNWIDKEEMKRYINEARKRDITKAEYRTEISNLKKYIKNNNSGEKKITPEAAKLLYNNIISIGFDNNHIPEGTKNKLYNHNATSFEPYFSSTYDDIITGLDILHSGLGSGDSISINEFKKPELKSVERYADKQLDPTDVAFTKHFFDRLNDPRNKKEITPAELTGFFKRLSKYKKKFKDFLQKYKEIVVKDTRTKINIPFVNMVNKIIAKTIMRKPDFKTNTPVYAMEIKTLHEIQQHTKKLMTEDKIAGGLADKITIYDIANKHNVDIDQIVLQLQKGIKVEMEHTSDTKVAEEIALDHLYELPDYYDRLEKVEEVLAENLNREFERINEDDARFRNDVATKPKIWYKLDTKDILKISDNIIDLVQTAYKNTPDGSYVNSKSDLKRSVFWNAIDVDDDFEADAVVFGRKSPQGIKIQGLGHDGKKKTKGEVIERLVKILKKPGHWVEASDALEKVLYKTGLPYVKSAKVVNSIFPGSDAKMTGNKGQYTRKLENGREITETIFGNPKTKVKENLDNELENKGNAL